MTHCKSGKSFDCAFEDKFKEFNDEQNAIIYDWMYEHEFGKEPMRVKVDGEEGTLSTAKDLYEFIDLVK